LTEVLLFEKKVETVYRILDEKWMKRNPTIGDSKEILQKVNLFKGKRII
jgi:hypothetical protein